MKVLLIAPPFELSSQEETGNYPLALGYIGAVLEKKGYEVKALDLLYEDWNKVKSKIYDRIISESPDIIGLSLMTTNRISAFEIVKFAKKTNQKIKVILGGVHPTIMYKQILESLPVDFIVLGEGEETIAELTGAIKKNSGFEKFKKIKGIAFNYKRGIVVTEPREYIKNLNKIPFPKHNYFSDKIEKFKTAYIACSRGCPIGCAFCSTSCHWGKIRRQRSAENVIKEIKEIKKIFPGLKKIYFLDDEFIMNHKWVNQFCDLIAKEKIKINFECAGRVSSVSEELVKNLKKTGFTMINFGVESGSQKIIDSICKKISLKQVINAFKICEKQKMRAGIYLMVGLPGENKKTVNETISLLKKIRNAKLDVPSLFQVYPGTEVYGAAKKKGFITDEYWLTEKVAPFYTIEHSKRKLFLWALKISLYYRFYQGNLTEFLAQKIKDNLKFGKIAKQIKKYLK